MNGHPGGEEHTHRMLKLASLPEGARILDLGAGDGRTVRLLRELGFRAEGIDLAPRSAEVLRADLLRTPYPDECFDALISQCAFFVSGDVPGALHESARLLKPGGMLLLSDVFFEKPEPMLSEAGFNLLAEEDMSMQWREYYFEALWREENCGCCLPKGKGKCSYLLLICRKVEKDGSV